MHSTRSRHSCHKVPKAEIAAIIHQYDKETRL